MKSRISYSDPEAKRYVRAWKAAAQKLEAVRELDIANANTKSAMLSLAGLINHAISREAPSESSGLVIQQSYFKKLRR